MAFLLITAAWGGPLSAQQPQIIEEAPSALTMICEPTSSPVGRDSVETRLTAEAERLTNAATQALLLGDLDGALEFLNRALRTDSTAAEALYLRSRIHFQRNELEQASEGFCRYLQLDPDGASAPEVRNRLGQAAEMGVAGDLYEAFARGVDRYRQGELEEAERAFDVVVEARPSAAEAVYNRGLTRALLARPEAARADLERYLALKPDAAERAMLRRYLTTLAGARGPAPGRAFLAGAVIPGAGQFYTGRPVLGTLVLGAAAGAVASGYLYERTTIRCRVADPDGPCPPDEIASIARERPYMKMGIVAALGIGLASAVEASFHAREARQEGYAGPADTPLQKGLERVGFDRGGLTLQLVRYRF